MKTSLTRYFLSLFILFSFFSLTAQVQPSQTPTLVEVPVYVPSVLNDFTKLEMAYAESSIANSEDSTNWQGKKVVQVDIVFTKYPLKREDWLTAYDVLLQRRLKALHDVDPALFADSSITWNYVLQTDCNTEPEAKKLFHGVVVHTQRTGRYTSLSDSGRRYRSGYSSMSTVEEITFGRKEVRDSTVVNVLTRHQDWDSMLVVLDWTGSMYKYGGSVLLWLRLNLNREPVSHIVLFNDGDRKNSSDKKVGKTYGIYPIRSMVIDSVLDKMELVMSRGGGGDDPENDVEALYRSTKNLKGYDQVILVADNYSSVRDIKLAKYLRHPVRIILCGVEEGEAIHADYLTLARTTGGSIHTIEADIAKLAETPEGGTVELNGHTYEYRRGEYKLVR